MGVLALAGLAGGEVGGPVKKKIDLIPSLSQNAAAFAPPTLTQTDARFLTFVESCLCVTQFVCSSRWFLG